MRSTGLPTTRLRLKSETGSTLVEFAFVIFLLLTMMLGITEFSRAVHAYHFVSNAAREASRYAAVRGATCSNDGSCWDDGHCTDIATPGCVGNYVNSMAPLGIDTSDKGCGGSACLSTAVSWPVEATSPDVCTTTDQKLPGCTVQVQVNYNFKFLFPFVSSNGLTLSSTSSMIIAH